MATCRGLNNGTFHFPFFVHATSVDVPRHRNGLRREGVVHTSFFPNIQHRFLLFRQSASAESLGKRVLSTVRSLSIAAGRRRSLDRGWTLPATMSLSQPAYAFALVVSISVLLLLLAQAPSPAAASSLDTDIFDENLSTSSLLYVEHDDDEVADVTELYSLENLRRLSAREDMDDSVGASREKDDEGRLLPPFSLPLRQRPHQLLVDDKSPSSASSSSSSSSSSSEYFPPGAWLPPPPAPEMCPKASVPLLGSVWSDYITQLTVDGQVRAAARAAVCVVGALCLRGRL